MKKRIVLSALIVAVLVLAACGSSPSSSSSSSRNDYQIFLYDKETVTLSIPFTCTDTQAFGWSRLWVLEKFGSSKLSYQDASIGLLKGWNEGQTYNSSPFWTWDYTFEITVNQNIAVLKIMDLEFGATSSGFNSQRSFNDFVDSYIKDICDDFQAYMQSK